MSGEFFTDFKSLNRIEISWLVPVLSNFNWFQGSPLGVVDGWIGVGWVWVDGGCHMHVHMHMHTHACMHMHVKHDKHWCLHVGGHLQFLYMYTCVCVHVHACMYMCMHVCVCGDTLHAPRYPQTPPPTCPSPEPQGAQNTHNSISPELIEIIWFCLKILYLWTFLNSYRL